MNMTWTRKRGTGAFLAIMLTLSSASFSASRFTVDSQGTPTSLVLADAQCLPADCSSSGFFLVEGNRPATQLKHVAINGNSLSVSESGGSPRFTFRIDSYPRHVSIHLTKIEGVTVPSVSLELRVQTTASLGAKAVDHLVNCNVRDGILTCKWNHLWRTDTAGELGCFAVYDAGGSDAAVDNTLAEIWSSETKMVRPGIADEWTAERVNQWVDEYARKFGPASNTMMLIEASSPGELHALTDLAIAHDIKRIYLHCVTWRGEYWPRNHTLDHVNTKVFPEGRSDLAGYAAFLHERGMTLYCHNVSLGIGKNDPNYIVGKVDHRLDAWGHGALEADAAADAPTLLFRPGPGTAKLPEYSESQVVNKRVTWDHMRIGDEIIRVGDYRDTDKPVWRLTKCSRGIGGTQAVAHSAGERGAGIWCAYNQNFVPPYDIAKPDSLLREMASRYADLVNDTKQDHIHFDGIEIHAVNPICEETAIDLVYSRVNRVVDSVRVGHPATASFELAFRRVDPWTYKSVKIPLRLDEKRKGDWLASSRLEAHFSITNCILYGSRTIEVCPPIGGAGLTLKTLGEHGLKDEMFGLLQDWRVILPAFTDADFAYLKTVVSRRHRSNHYESEDVPVLTKEDGKYRLQPHRIMGQANGRDPLTKFVQERGTIIRKQTMKTGDTLSLVNPYSAQGAAFYIRVLPGNTPGLVNPTVTTGDGAVQVAGTVLPRQYLHYDGSSSTAIVYDRSWNTVSTPAVARDAYTMPKGTADVSVSTEPPNPGLTLDVQFITKGPKYALEANQHLGAVQGQAVGGLAEQPL